VAQGIHPEGKGREGKGRGGEGREGKNTPKLMGCRQSGVGGYVIKKISDQISSLNFLLCVCVVQ
jgi:hypothetical protein